jgi:hypothetical protein
MRYRSEMGAIGLRRAAMVALVAIGSASASAQEGSEYRGTQDQQMACTGDVFRLCWNEIPSVSRIVGCLQREKPQLTAACRAVFDQNAPRTASNRLRRHHRIASATSRSPSPRYEYHSE